MLLVCLAEFAQRNDSSWMEFWGPGRVRSALPLREAGPDASRGHFAGSPICRTFVASLAEFGLLVYVDRAARVSLDRARSRLFGAAGRRTQH